MSDLRSMSEGRGSAEIMTFIAGAALGAGLALLIAPCSGTETRRRLGDAARKLQDNARSTVSNVKERLDHTAHNLRDAVSEGRDAYARARTAGSSAPMTRENV